MLNKIFYSYFTLAALTALAQKIVSLLSAKLPDNQMAIALLTRFQPQLEAAIQAIGSTTKTPLTAIVKQADLKRDNSFRSLRDHVRAGLNRENETYRSACEALWPEFEKNGTHIDKLPRDKQTASTNSLLTDLRKPKNQAHLVTTNTIEWLTELDNDNRAYVTATTQRSSERSVDDTVLDHEAFKALRTSLDLMENILNTMQAMGDPVDVDEVVAEISQYITEANTAAKQSKNNGNTNPENPGETE
ncbi:DUF6261 family protein [uncultured Draconibacterium sp.]|uniref:DUF6261 family protein n=1 Tax=uncultured Draconibacterium sp. TaxID=1573823 RepID=UPI0032176D31